LLNSQSTESAEASIKPVCRKDFSINKHFSKDVSRSPSHVTQQTPQKQPLQPQSGDKDKKFRVHQGQRVKDSVITSVLSVPLQCALAYLKGYNCTAARN